MGRPSDFTQEMADTICERLAAGESLRKMCLEDDNLPNERTVYRWLGSHEDFCQKYARARERQAEPHLEDILEIADADDIKPEDKRVRIDARKWAMSKLAARRYGDKTILGNDPDNPLPAPASDIDLARLIAFQLTKASREAG